jgi:hypothetical protein
MRVPMGGSVWRGTRQREIGTRANLFGTFLRLSSRARAGFASERRFHSGGGIIGGSSHIMCFGVPLRSATGRVNLVPLDATEGSFQCLNGPFPRSKAYWRKLE